MEQSSDIWTAWEHLHCARGTGNFGGILRPSDKELNKKYVLAIREAQNLVHPWLDPFKTLVVTNYPNESDAPCGNGAVVVSLNQRPEKRNLVSDTGAASKKDDMAIAAEIVMPAIGAFKVGFHAEGPVLIGSGNRPVVEPACHTILGTDNEAHRGGNFTLDKTKFLLRNRELLCLWAVVGPSDREWVRLPPASMTKTEIGMTAWLDINITGKVQGDTDGFSRHGLNKSLCLAAGGPIVINHSNHTGEAIGKPKGEDCDDNRQLRKGADARDVSCNTVNVGSYKDDKSEDNVNVKKSLIKGTAESSE